MKILGRVKVFPKIPEKISRIKELAYNLWWVWNYEAQDLFIKIDDKLWEKCKNNPLKFLIAVEQEKLSNIIKDKNFIKDYNSVLKKFDDYINSQETWFNKYNKQFNIPNSIAYFSAEFGLHESLPIYSGGLGILAGDHLKTASDLGMPLVAVGLMYKKGYFEQEIASDGSQLSNLLETNFSEIPIIKITDENNETLKCSVRLAGRDVYFQIWKICVGRINLFLLDTNLPENNDIDKKITDQLYGGDQEKRISQEIILGMGGVKALKAMGIKPKIFHMNEGHSVFSGLERIKEIMKENNLNFYQAFNAVQSSTIFTTHTPVPAGNDAFPLYLKDKYFREYWESVGISREKFLEFGRDVTDEGFELFSLTILALRLSGYSNGVSKLHGYVSRNIWSNVWKDLPANESPISYVTNGIHTFTWMAESMQHLLTKYLGENWKENLTDTDMWEKIDSIPEKELWETHIQLKSKMVDYLRFRIKNQLKRHGVTSLKLNAVDKIINKDSLIIGFARRFATYKRANLLFRDMDRIKSILNKTDKPVVFLFAGKAHPADKPGQAYIKQIWEYSHKPGFEDKIFILENYDMHLAKFLVAGVDVWLNNPRRPHEASGTSGQKVPCNGGINLSIADGWWPEAYNGKNGWVIGDETEYPNTEIQDKIDSEHLYNLLEKEVIPTYYSKNPSNLPDKWIKMMKESMKTVIPQFSTARMLMDYSKKLYIPAINTHNDYWKNNFELSKNISDWKNRIFPNWHSISIEPLNILNPNIINEIDINSERTISVKIKCYQILKDDLKVEVYMRNVENHKIFETFELNYKENINDNEMIFEGNIKPSITGEYEYAIRVFPYKKGLVNKFILGLIRWI